MAKINRFMKPVERQVSDSYVSQYVPLPFEAMKKRSEEMNKENVDAETGIDNIYSSFKQDFNIVDREMLKEKSNEIRGTIDNLLNEHGGEPRRISHEIRNLTRNVQNWLNSDEGKLATDNRKAELESIKLVQDSKMLTKDKNRSLIHRQNLYEIQGGAEKGASYKRIQTYDPVDLTAEANKMIEGLNKSENSNVVFYVDEDKGFIVTGHEDSGGVSKERIKPAISSLKKNPNFISMVDFNYEIDTFDWTYRKNNLGQFELIPESEKPDWMKIEDETKRKQAYTEAFFNSMIDGNSITEAHHYVTENNRLNVQQISDAGNGAVKPNAIPDFNISSVANVDGETGALQVAKTYKDSKDPFMEMINQKANNYNSLFGFNNNDINNSELFKEFSARFPSASNEEGYVRMISGIVKESLNNQDVVTGQNKHLSQMINGLSDKQTYDLIKGNAYMQRIVSEGIANGKIDLTKEGRYTKEQASYLKERANFWNEKQRENDQLNVEAFEHLNKVGKVNNKDYKNIEEFRKTIDVALSLTNVESLLNNYKGDDKAKVKQIVAGLFNKMEGISDGFITQEQLSELQKEFDKYNTLVYGAKATDVKDYKNKTSQEKILIKLYEAFGNEDLKKSITNSQSAFLSKEGKEIINGFIKDRASYVADTKPSYTQEDLKIRVETKKGKKDYSLNEYLRTGGGLAQHQEAIFASPISPGSKTTIGGDIDRIVRTELGINSKTSLNDLEPNLLNNYKLRIKEEKEKVLNNALFINELTNTGDYQLMLNSRYRLSLNSNGVNLPWLDKYISPEQKNELYVNSLKTRATMSMVKRYPIPNSKGLYLTTKDGELRFTIDGGKYSKEGEYYPLSPSSSNYKDFTKIIYLLRNGGINTDGLTEGEYLYKQLKGIN